MCKNKYLTIVGKTATREWRTLDYPYRSKEARTDQGRNQVSLHYALVTISLRLSRASKSIRLAGFQLIAGPERIGVLKAKYPDIAEYIDKMAAADPTNG